MKYPDRIKKGSIVCLLSMLTACAEPARSPEGSQQADTLSRPAPHFLKDEERLSDAAQQLRRQVAASGKMLFVFGDVHFYREGRIVLELIDTNRAFEVTRYEYRNNAWKDMGALQVAIQQPFCRYITPLDDIPFRCVPGICLQWETKARSLGMAGGEPENIYFSLWVADQDRSWIAPPLDSAGISCPMVFNRDGSLRASGER